eukprot:6358257-Prymnesium_polylepis.1
MLERYQLRPVGDAAAQGVRLRRARLAAGGDTAAVQRDLAQRRRARCGRVPQQRGGDRVLNHLTRGGVHRLLHRHSVGRGSVHRIRCYRIRCHEAFCGVAARAGRERRQAPARRELL